MWDAPRHLRRAADIAVLIPGLVLEPMFLHPGKKLFV